MAIIDTNNAAYGETSDQFWRDELSNARILLDAVDRAIYSLTTKGIASYTIDTGQTRQAVTRSDLSMLQNWRTQLIVQISTLEARFSVGGSRAVRIVPL
jgi:hypothetical protein